MEKLLQEAKEGQVSGLALVVLRGDPAAIQEQMKKVEADRIRVEFSSPDHHTTWKIEIRLEGGKDSAEQPAFAQPSVSLKRP